MRTQRTLAVVSWTRLVRIHQKVEQASERHFRKHGLNSSWFDVLVRVGTSPGIAQGELADKLLVTKGNISQLVAKMVDAGLLVRRADGRRFCLELSSAGQDLRDRALPGQEALLAESLKSLTDAEQTELNRLLKKWGER